MTNEVPLQEHLEKLIAGNDLRYQQRFDAQTTAVNAALLAAKEAVDTAKVANEKRLDSVNEFRAQQGDIVRETMPRSEIQQRFTALEDKVASKNLQVMLSLGVGFIGVLIAVFNLASAYN